MTTTAAPIDYRALFHALPGSYLLLAPDGTVLDNSDEHVAVSMLPREQSVGRNIFDAYPSAPESQRDLDASHEEVRRTRRPHTMPLLRYDLERPAEQGGGTEVRYWQITHYPILDAQGQLQFILQIPQDVTAQHQATQQAAEAKEALDEAQNRTEFILESLPVLVWTNRPDGTPDYFNQRWLDFTGKSLAEMLALDWDALTYPDDRAGLQRGWQQALADGTPFQYEYRMRRHDGQYRWVLIRTSPRRDAQGAISMWVGAASDVHERRQMVQELLTANETQAELAEQSYQLYQKAENQRETFHSLFMQAPAMICILRGPEHRYEFVNPVYQQIFPHRELVGRTVAEALPELHDQGIFELLDHVYQSGETFHAHELPLQLERDASQQLRDSYFNFTYQQFRENGQPAGIMVFAYEVTDLVRARQALEKLREQGPGAGTPELT
ncbi:PAS domain-containing protein [Hymenobacter properus]|uniref:histidine kinase n=1 Tax=Hymenobacter properus TaxID=2791026 RepID=A0A931BMY3_9BACT|nr:PAS domain-containing protein [Hymenobacter properus]MBF9144266.1 PAS domain-containing protein [Hymenobacter properus]MBR7723084.1 PAS domain-containing protein [Microvirga sp. SRT04]